MENKAKQVVASLVAVLVGLVGAIVFQGKAEAAATGGQHNFCVHRPNGGGKGWGVWEAAKRWNPSPYVQFYLRSNGNCPRGATPVYVRNAYIKSTKVANTELWRYPDRLAYANIRVNPSWYNRYRKADRIAALVHEFGHVVGIGHERGTVMNPYLSDGGPTYPTRSQLNRAR